MKKNVLSISLSTILVLSLFVMAIGPVASAPNSVDSISDPNFQISEEFEEDLDENETIPPDQDVEEVLDVNLAPGDRMSFWLTEINNRGTFGGVLEANYNVDNDTPIQLDLKNIPSEDISYYKVYHNGNLVSLPIFSTGENIDEDLQSHLSGQIELSESELESKTPNSEINGNTLSTWIYATPDPGWESSAGAVRVVAVSDGSPICNNVELTTDDDGRVTNVNDIESFTACVESGDLSEINIDGGSFTIIDNSTVRINGTSDIEFPDGDSLEGIDGLDVRSQIVFEEKVTFTDTAGTEHVVNETAIVDFDRRVNAGDLDVINETFKETDENDVAIRNDDKINFSKDVIAYEDNISEIDRTQWNSFEESIENGLVTFTEEPESDSLYEIETQDSSVIVSNDDFEEINGNWVVDISHEVEEGTVENIDYYGGAKSFVYQNIDPEVINNMVDVEVEVIDFEERFIWESEDGIEYITTPGDDGTVIPPTSETIVINETTIENPFIDVPGDFDSIKWQACDVNFQRPGGDGETNKFLMGNSTEVTMKPNEVIVSDRSGNEVENTSYSYPSQESIEVETGEGIIEIFNDNVYVPECAYVIDSGAGVNLPSTIGDTEFNREANTYYLDTEMIIKPFGLVDEYIDDIQDKEAVSGFNVNPVSGDVSVRIDSMDRSVTDTFGATVTEFTLNEVENPSAVDITIHDLQPGREYALYTGDEVFQSQVANEDGSVTFGKSQDDWNGEQDYVLVVDERSQETSDSESGILPSISLSSPAIILMVVTSSLLATAGYLYWRREGFGEDNATIAWYR